MQVIDRVLDVDSTLTGEHVRMSIDQSALQHIMGVLTDLYSDPELAVLREYSTNALDSHVEAGIARPIEVTLPSPLSPFLRVRDYGVGLDGQGIREVYSQYGTSTKRTSNDVVGMLGLGCKSALTYTDQVTLTGWKDGVMTQASMGRDEDGTGYFIIVAEEVTDEPNGVEIVIPAKRDHDFEAKADLFFSFWEEGTVLVNGEPPARVEGIWLDDNLLVTDKLDQAYVVMGNVAYPWPEGPNFGRGGWRYDTNRYEGKHYAVAFVPIGAVQFTPSREALQLTKYTRAKLDELSAAVTSKLFGELTAQIQNAATPEEALELHSAAMTMGLKTDRPLFYKGREIHAALNRDHKVSNPYILVGREGNSYRNTRKTGEQRMSVPVLSQRTTMWFDNFDGKELTATKRDKLAVWLEQNNLTMPERLILVDKLTATEKFWLSGQTVHDWTPVGAIKIKRDTPLSTSGRPRGSYQGRKDGTWSESIVADTIDTTKPLVWDSGNRYAVMGDYAIKVGLIPDEATVIALPSNRVEKFKRDFPTAVRISDYATKAALSWLDGLDHNDRAAALYQQQHGRKLSVLDENRIDDPALAREILLAKRQVTPITERLQKYRHMLPPRTPVATRLDAYPLLGESTYAPLKHHDHTYLYVNAAYAAEMEAS